MKALTFTINLLEPLLATGLEGDPNAGVTQSYIAGSVLRGAIIRLYLKSKGKKQLQLTPEERDLFFNGTVNFLNSYPVANTENGKNRSLPTPLAWQKEKDSDGNSFKNFCKVNRDNESYKNLSNQFFVFESNNFTSSNTIIAAQPKKRLAVHIKRSITGNTGENSDSQVFRYESIAEGTSFNGAILSEDEKLLKEIEILINEAPNKKVIVHLGGSRTAGYGKAEFVSVSSPTDWYEPQVSNNVAVSKGDTFSITLLSNVLIRDENGQFQADLTAEDLGIQATPCEKKTFKRAELVGGFNRKWGLPLPQMLSIKAGSVFTFIANESITVDKINELHAKGIGERRLDGFGRIAVNLNNQYGLMEWKEEKPDEVADNIIQNDLIDQMAMRILRQKLDSQLVALVNQNDAHNRISNSQLSRLRLFIRELLRNPQTDHNHAKEEVKNFFSQLKSIAKNQFENVRVRGDKHSGNLESWTKKVIESLDCFESKTLYLGGKTFDSASLDLEYHLRLIDGVLAKAAKVQK